MKKLLALAVIAAAVFGLVKRKKGQSNADVWQQATRQS
jgi:hypothetical protein